MTMRCCRNRRPSRRGAGACRHGGAAILLFQDPDPRLFCPSVPSPERLIADCIYRYLPGNGAWRRLRTGENMRRSDNERAAPDASTRGNEFPGPGSGGIARSDLRMARELMLDLAHQAAELLVNRIEGLPEEGAWDGDFQKELEDRLLEDPPEEGRPPAEVIERAAREVLPFATRLDHPRCFAFVPSAPTCFRGAGRLHRSRMQLQRRHLAGLPAVQASSSLMVVRVVRARWPPAIRRVRAGC